MYDVHDYVKQTACWQVDLKGEGSMKIIRKGTPPKNIKRFECLQCGCIFDAGESEYKCEEFYGFSVKCSCCGEMTGRVVESERKR